MNVEALNKLTPREQAVVRLRASGLSYAAIGGDLGISEKTVSVHMMNVRNRLGMPSVSMAMELLTRFVAP